MKSLFESNFIFVVCQIGAEKALKNELAREHPEFKFAYSRPGFITFKNAEAKIPLEFSLRSVFARAYGVSIPEAKTFDPAQIAQVAKDLAEAYPKRRLRLHVWERDFHTPGEEPLGYERGLLARPFEQKLRNLAPPQLFETSSKAELNDLVLNVILLEEGLTWVGCHIQTAFHSSWPGGSPPIVLPPESPSRAYLKLEEGLLWSGAPILKGDTAVEIGSAPGGASYALLQHGLNVVGIDPGKMDDIVLKNPRFRHFQKPVNDLLREDLPSSIQWLMLDMNVEPRISLFAVDRFVSRMQDSLLGILLTIKLNQWNMANEIPSMLEHIRAMGMVRIKAAQLFHCRQEFMIYGITRKGLTRKK